MSPSSPIELLPDAWKIAVTVITGGGKDRLGNKTSVIEYELAGCLLSVKANSEGGSDSDLVRVQATLYTPTGAALTSTDKVRTHPGAPVVGIWSVNGEPVHWPFGAEVPLIREDVNA